MKDNIETETKNEQIDKLQDKLENKPQGNAINKKNKYTFLFRFIRKTALFVLIIFILLTFVFKIFRMTGNTMYPYVQDGDLCIFYRLDNLYLNDVVIYEDEDGNECIGRVRATGGQVVSFNEEGGYSVDGYQPIEENPYETYAAEDMTAEDTSADDIVNDTSMNEATTEDDVGENRGITYPLTLNDNEYFILNDFRRHTTDSRELGAIDKSRIKGKLIFLLRRRNF